MGMNRRTFMASVGGVAAVGLTSGGEAHPKARASAALPVQQAALEGFDAAALRDRANDDGEFRLAAREWHADVRLGIGDHTYDAVIRAGRVTEVRPARSGDTPAVSVTGPMDAWTLPDGFAARGLRVEGDEVGHLWPYQPAISRLSSLVRETLGTPVPELLGEEVDRDFDTVVGRYAYVRIRGTQYRVYFEEAGEGIPMVLQHTAGSDSRQWRHLLEDRELQQRFRMIAYDLPFHGRSLPPTGVRWWANEYKADTALLMDSIVAISHALKLDRPVYMGCSVGGYLAPDLALYHPDEFRAVIGVNSAIAGGRHDEVGKPYISPYNHPNNSSAYIGASMYQGTSPEAREAYRRETGWVYSQGGPGIFAGDLYYFSVEHNLIGKAHKIDTSKIGVHFLSGEYDATARGPAEELAAEIKGSTYDVVKGGSHFTMSDDYPRFRTHLMPVLDGIHAKHTGV